MHFNNEIPNSYFTRFFEMSSKFEIQLSIKKISVIPGILTSVT